MDISTLHSIIYFSHMSFSQVGERDPSASDPNKPSRSASVTASHLHSTSKTTDYALNIGHSSIGSGVAVTDGCDPRETLVNQYLC